MNSWAKSEGPSHSKRQKPKRRDLQIVAMDSGGSLNPLLQISGQYESAKTLDLHLILQMKKLYFCSQRGKSGSASDGVTYDVKGPFIKI